MKLKKRLIALALVTVMCLSALPMTVFAGNGNKNEASLTQHYELFNGEEWEKFVYETTEYPTLAEALKAAEAQPDYWDKLGLPEEMSYYFVYMNPIITLNEDVTVKKDEVLEYNSEMTVFLDLNGHTLDIKGRFAGGYDSEMYDPEIDGMVPVTYPSDIGVQSSVPGVFKSSGIIDVSIMPWTADTYYITGGQVNGFFGADGGNINISGGVFSGSVFFNNGSDAADLVINLSGDAEFLHLDFWVYSMTDMRKMIMTVSDSVKIADMKFGIMGPGKGNKPNLIINGGYFDSDPEVMLHGYKMLNADEVDHDNLEQYYVDRYGEYVPYSELEDWEKETFTEYYVYSDTCWKEFIEFCNTPQKFAGQNDWNADEGKYPWRVVGSASALRGDCNGDGAVDNKDVVVLFRYVSGNESGYDPIYDFNEDGAVDNKDVVALIRYISTL